jgi:hypothetical protein
MSSIPNSTAFFKPDPLTSTSTGTAFDGGWQRWWRHEARITGTDWASLLRQHERFFQQLCQLH